MLAIPSGMYRTCIAVVDAARARLFTLERTLHAEGVREEMIERQDLINPARRLRASELFSENPGSVRMGSLHFGVDDHRTNHIEELDAAFAREVTSAISSQIDANPTQRLILCASPHMLGELRQTLDKIRRPALAIDEIPRDLVKVTPSKLRDQLESYGLLPSRPTA